MQSAVTPDMVNLGITEHESLQSLVSAKKYQLGGEESFQDVISRVCRIFSKESKYSSKETADICEMVYSGKFIPAGSILFGLGNDEIRCSLSNCYLTKIEHDSLEDIFEAQKQMARTYSFRGGTGVDITVLRPKGTNVDNAAKTSSGAVSFLPLFSDLTNTIGQNGRRGALLVSLDIRHPDVMDFIWCKSKPEEVFGKDSLTGKTPDVFGANISLKLTDDFMLAVQADGDWTFTFPDIYADKAKYDAEWDGDYTKWKCSGGLFKSYGTMKARAIFRAICESNWLSGDPGVMFMDTMQHYDPGTFIHPDLKPMSTNPCGELAMAYWNNCLLGALVLSKYVVNPWTKESFFDRDAFLSDVSNAIMFLDMMSDLNIHRHPLKEQRDADAFGKRLGLEITGLADALAMLGLEYGGEDSLDFIEDIMQAKALEEVSTSCQLSERFGPCKAMEDQDAREGFVESPYAERLDITQRVQDKILRFGLRNCGFNTIGPCGSISIMSDNCSSGIEPIFKFSYRRETRLSDKAFDFIHMPALKALQSNAAHLLESEATVASIKKELCYVEADELDYKKRLRVQGSLQKFISASISSTLNLPETCTVEEMEDIYFRAWEEGLKGCTVFRDGCKKGVLSSSGSSEQKTVSPPETSYTPIVTDLFDVEKAERHRVYWKNAKLYVMVSLDEEDNPLEVFVKLPREAGVNGGGVYNEQTYQEKFSLWETVTRLVSLLLRSGLPLALVIKQLDKSSYSLVDAAAILSRVLKKYLHALDSGDKDITLDTVGTKCPDCGEMSYVNENGCGMCKSCGYSKCS